MRLFTKSGICKSANVTLVHASKDTSAQRKVPATLFSSLYLILEKFPL